MKRMARLAAGVAIAVALAAAVGVGRADAGLLPCAYPTITQPFSAWGDLAKYYLSPGGGFENGGWKFGLWRERGQRQRDVLREQPVRFAVTAAPPGASAQGPYSCIGATDLKVRMFVRSDTSAPVRVDVVVPTLLGLSAHGRHLLRAHDAELAAGSQAIFNLGNALSLLMLSGGNISVKVTAANGTAQVDDVYIDPSCGSSGLDAQAAATSSRPRSGGAFCVSATTSSSTSTTRGSNCVPEQRRARRPPRSATSPRGTGGWSSSRCRRRSSADDPRDQRDVPRRRARRGSRCRPSARGRSGRSRRPRRAGRRSGEHASPSIVCVWMIRRSSSSSGPGLLMISDGDLILPTSCSSAANSASRRSASRARARSATSSTSETTSRLCCRCRRRRPRRRHRAAARCRGRRARARARGRSGAGARGRRGSAARSAAG